MLSVYNNHNEAGIDEAGRGCWWGPVVASAVIWPKDLKHPYLTDSKKLTEKRRNELFPWIKQKCKYGIGFASSKEIDSIGILNATKLAMNRAITELESTSKEKPHSLIIDGINWKQEDFKYNISSIVKGDAKYFSIAAASVLAKVSRDNYTVEASKKNSFKNYKLEKHKGYGTKIHRELLDKYGPSEEHRFSFKPIRKDDL